MFQILELQLIESDSIDANSVNYVETSPAETRPVENSPVENELTYPKIDYSVSIQALITQTTRNQVPMAQLNDDPEASLGTNFPNDITTKTSNTNLI